MGRALAAWRTGPALGELVTMAVLPDDRGAGVGTALFEEIERRLRSAGVSELSVTTPIANVEAGRFYERRGMTPVFQVLLRRL
jgi:GNAT superfamily N-acetyltransferase